LKNLINFILKNVHWLLFFLLIFLSVFLLVRNNEFQRSKYLAVFQEIAGRVYSVSNGVESYMNLRTINDGLTKRVADLEDKVRFYQKQVETLTDLSGSHEIKFDMDTSAVYHFIPARIVHNQVSGIENYITINKGSLDGISADMGVLTYRGIVGVVTNVSSHFARVIPLLNSKFQTSGKIINTGYFGPLVWDGKDSRYTYLRELPRHATFNIGDTIVTSGYSTFFPEGIPVGTVEASYKQKNDDYNSLKVKLFTDFNTLSEVLVINNTLKEEQKNIEKGVIDQ
jgi:rod shape-determining protein MreC